MTTENLPPYLSSAQPNAPQNRSPWYANIAPSYAGVFLTIMFYETLGNALPLGGLPAALIGLVLAGLLSYLLFFSVFGQLGMQTGLPLYVVGSSTFGAQGGYLIPGIFMGILQVGWYSVSTFLTSRLLVQAMGLTPLTPFAFDPANRGFSLVFAIIAVVGGYLFATVGALGINYVSRISLFVPFVPLAMLIIAAVSGAPGVGEYRSGGAQPLAAALLMAQLTIGYIATAGAAGVDFGVSSRHERDVRLGGLVGITLTAIVAGGLTLLTVAGAHGLNPSLNSFTFSGSLSTVSPQLAKIMFLLFAISNMPPTCFCAFIMGNSLSTMIPRVPHLTWALGGATIGIILSVLGLAGNLEPFFGLVGASFGPVCGAMVADYLLSGHRWPGPRRGVNIPGYAAWLIGFLVGISNNDLVAAPVGRPLLPGWHPAGIYSFVVGFAIYVLLARVGLEASPMPSHLTE